MSAGRRGRSGHEGFTLIEVLAGLAIFAVAAVALAAAYVNLLTNYKAAVKQESIQTDLRWLREPLLTETDRDKAEQGGDAALPGGGQAHWRSEIEETDVADLFKVTWHVDISPDNGATIQPIEQTFYLLRPDWSDKAESEKLRKDFQKRLEDERATQP